MKKILLLDIENVHKSENELLKYLSHYHFIYLVYAKSPVNFSLDGLVKISPYIVNGKLKVLKMPKIGKDAADFGLTFIAGQLSTQVKAKEYSFEVMSNDHSMEYVVDLLKIAQFEAKIINEKPLVSKQIAKDIKLEIDVKLLVLNYCQNLAKETFSRPAKLDSLINSVKANLKIENDVAKVVIDELKVVKAIRVNENKISYNNPSIIKAIKILTAEIEKKLTALRLRLMPFLNTTNYARPKYLAGFTVLLERYLPKAQIEEALFLLQKYDLIQIDKRQVIYSPTLLGN